MLNILLSTYNGEKYIEHQLDSIHNQTYSDYHIYIRDDGSNDNTLSIIKNYIEKNDLYDKTTLFAENNVGFSNSFGKLLLASQEGDYWAFCDQDDYWYPDKLNNAVKWFEENENNAGIPLMYYGRVGISDSNLKNIKKCSFEVFEYNYYNSFTSNIFFGFSMVINRGLYDRLVKTNFNRIKYHDWFAAMIVTAFGDYHISSEIEALHRTHDNNTSPNVLLDKISDGKKLIKGKNFYSDNAGEFYRLFKDDLNDDQLEWCKRFINPGKDLKTQIKKAFYLHRYNPSIIVGSIQRMLMLIGRI